VVAVVVQQVVAVTVGQFVHTLLKAIFQTHKTVKLKYKTGRDLNKR
jgi:hypothetical protein